MSVEATAERLDPPASELEGRAVEDVRRLVLEGARLAVTHLARSDAHVQARLALTRRRAGRRGGRLEPSPARGRRVAGARGQAEAD